MISKPKVVPCSNLCQLYFLFHNINLCKGFNCTCSLWSMQISQFFTNSWALDSSHNYWDSVSHQQLPTNPNLIPRKQKASYPKRVKSTEFLGSRKKGYTMVVVPLLPISNTNLSSAYSAITSWSRRPCPGKLLITFKLANP